MVSNEWMRRGGGLDSKKTQDAAAGNGEVWRSANETFRVSFSSCPRVAIFPDWVKALAGRRARAWLAVALIPRAESR